MMSTVLPMSLTVFSHVSAGLLRTDEVDDFVVYNVTIVAVGHGVVEEMLALKIG